MATKKAVKKTTTKKATKPAPITRAIVPADAMLEEEAVVNAPRSSLSVYSNQPVLDSSDLLIPKLRLAQGLTPEVQNGEAKPGQWLILGEMPMSDVSVIPVALTRRREYRDPDTRSTILCRSGDGVTGVGNPGGECASCEMAQWTAPRNKRAGGTNTPPACAFIYSYMVYLDGLQSMALLEFSRTSLNVGKMLNTMIAQRGVGTFAIKLGAVGRQGPKGTFYAPTVTMEAAKPDVLKRAMNKAQTLI